jgi:molybdate transport system ATP-binding protein
MVFSLKDAVVKRNGIRLINEFSWEVNEGECWLICGTNGSGKTTLLELLSGHERFAEGVLIPPENISIENYYSSVALIRRDFTLYHLFNSSANFYQQRYFSLGVEETPPVIDFIISETGEPEEHIRSAALEFEIEKLMDKHIVSLSTGEGRRILLLLLWLSENKIICLDDPYAGLDPDGKLLVSRALKMLLKKNITILITSVDLHPPEFINHILLIENQYATIIGKTEYLKTREIKHPHPIDKLIIKDQVLFGYDYSFNVAAGMRNITIKYGDSIVQKDFSWEINRGDKWMLSGPNGSGKSTLMSLIFGDNPMAYAYEIVVFDRVRGTGETIWDVKRPMGYFSSELQQFFPRNMTLYEAVLTGFSDHLSVRSDLTPEHYHQADELIEAARITPYKETSLGRLSFSTCRLALVCRALVKLPPVVILDEPCQGLDQITSETVNDLVDIVCGGKNKTLIYVTHQTDLIPEVINKKLELKKYILER